MSEVQWDQETAIDKVSKLLAKAESTTPEEAEALTAKALEIMQRHSIDEAMLSSTRKDQTDEIIQKTFTLRGIFASAQQSICFAVGRGFDMRLLQGGTSKAKTATLIGWKSDMVQAEALIGSLLIQGARAQAIFTESLRYNGWESFVARRSFLVGFAQEVQSRLWRIRQEQVKAAEARHAETAADDGTPGVALVLRSRKQQIDDWMDQTYTRLGKGRSSRSRYSGSGAAAGRQAGARADLGTSRVGGGSKGSLGR